MNSKSFSKFKNNINNAFHSSFFYSFFRSHDNIEAKFKQSLIYSLLSKTSIARFASNFKNTFARGCENSFIATNLKGFYEKLCICSVRSYAIVLLYFAIYAVGIWLIKYSINEGGISSDNLYYSILMFVLSLILMPVKDSVVDFFSSSKIVSLFSASFLMSNVFDNNSTSKVIRPSNSKMILTGTILGLLSSFLSIKTLVFSLIFLFFVLAVFRTPEIALPISILLTPFSDQVTLLLLVTVGLIAYFFKVLRGKRNLKFGFFDVCVALVLLILAAGSITSVGYDSKVFVFFLIGLSYFIFRNCATDRKICRKCVYALALSGGISGLMVIYNSFLTSEYTKTIVGLVPETIDITTVKYLFQNVIAIGEYLLFILPFVFTAFIIAKSPYKKLLFMLLSVFCVFGIVCTTSKGIILALLVCMLIFVAASFKNPLTSLITILFFGLAFTLFITHSSFLGADRFFNISGYNQSVYDTMIKASQSNIVAGIGFGNEAFSSVYSLFSGFGGTKLYFGNNTYLHLLMCVGIIGMAFFFCTLISFYKMQFSAISHARNNNLRATIIAIAAIASISTMCVRGLTSFIFADIRTLYLFFAILGISSASYYSLHRERTLIKEEQL